MKLRVLHCPTNTGGHPWYLSRAERKLGLQSDLLTTRSHSFSYPSDKNLGIDTVSPIEGAWVKWKSFSHLVDQYDVFHFNYGSSLIDFPFIGLHHLDFPLLKKRNKKIFVTYQGCDVRLRSECLRHFESSACHPTRHWHCSWPADWVKRQRVKKAEKYADKIFVLNPDLFLSVPSAELEMYASLDLDEIKPAPFEEGKPIRILHAPSNEAIKGTRFVKEAVERLQREGYGVALVLVQGKSHEEALKLYRTAHIVVDQLFAGWYGVFAVEAMALAKPVLCYLRESDLEKFVPFRSEIPILNVTQKSLYEQLKRLVEDPGLRCELGLKGRAYVEKHHDPLKIARRIIGYYSQAF